MGRKASAHDLGAVLTVEALCVLSCNKKSSLAISQLTRKIIKLAFFCKTRKITIFAAVCKPRHKCALAHPCFHIHLFEGIQFSYKICTVSLFARVVNETSQWCIAGPTIIYRGLEQAGPRSLYAK